MRLAIAVRIIRSLGSLLAVLAVAALSAPVASAWTPEGARYGVGTETRAGRCPRRRRLAGRVGAV